MNKFNCYSRRTGQKKKYASKNLAENDKKLMEKQHHIKFNVYLCIWCGFYHIGKDNGREDE